MKKIKVQKQKECQAKIKRENTRTQTLKRKICNLSSKNLSRYQTNIFLCGLKFTPTPKRSNIELKSNIIAAKMQTILRKNNLLLQQHETGIEFR